MTRQHHHAILLSRPLRQRRSYEWDSGRAVTFIVTLAATRNVTLAARRSGMSRKSAYALKGRDPAFAALWGAALAAGRPKCVKGDKVEEVDAPPIPLTGGDGRLRDLDAELRDRFFSTLAAIRRDSVAQPRHLP